MNGTEDADLILEVKGKKESREFWTVVEVDGDGNAWFIRQGADFNPSRGESPFATRRFRIEFAGHPVYFTEKQYAENMAKAWNARSAAAGAECSFFAKKVRHSYEVA